MVAAFIETTVKDYVKMLDDRLMRLRRLMAKVNERLSEVNANPAALGLLRFKGGELVIVNGSDDAQLNNALGLILELARLQEGIYTLVRDDLGKIADKDVKLAVIEPLGLPTRILLVSGNVASNK